jgi:hypothetical protein
MPGTAFKDVSLDVQGDQFLVRAPHYKLALHLQHVVDDKKASSPCTVTSILPSNYIHAIAGQRQVGWRHFYPERILAYSQVRFGSLLRCYFLNLHVFAHIDAQA